MELVALQTAKNEACEHFVWMGQAWRYVDYIGTDSLGLVGPKDVLGVRVGVNNNR